MRTLGKCPDRANLQCKDLRRALGNSRDLAGRDQDRIRWDLWVAAWDLEAEGRRRRFRRIEGDLLNKGRPKCSTVVFGRGCRRNNNRRERILLDLRVLLRAMEATWAHRRAIRSTMTNTTGIGARCQATTAGDLAWLHPRRRTLTTK